MLETHELYSDGLLGNTGICSMAFQEACEPWEPSVWLTMPLCFTSVLRRNRFENVQVLG